MNPKPPADPQIERLKQAAMDALRDGQFDLADRLLARGEVTLAELTHNLRVYQAELEMQAQELREANARLDLAVHRFRRLFDLLPQAALVVDRQGVVRRRNAVAERLFGTEADALAKPALRRLAADAAARAALHGALAEAQANGHGHAAGLQLVDSQARAHTGDVYVERLDTPGDDAEEQYVVLVVDETERVVAADHLRSANLALRTQQRENRMLAAVARSTQAMVVVTDARRRVTWVNAAFERASGWAQADIVGQSLSRLQGPGTDPAIVSMMRQRLDSALGFTGVEVLNYTRTGTPYWVRLDVQPILDDDGVPEAFVSVQTEVTEQRRVEADLREAEALQRAVLDAAPVLIATLRADGQVGGINPAGLAMLQLSDAAQAVGRALADFVVPASQATFASLRTRAMLGESGRARVTVTGADGRLLPLELGAGPMWSGGRVQQVVVVGHDVSLEQALAEERAAKEAALASSRAKSRFLSQMSHELRTPLNAVLGFTQLLRTDVDQGRLDPDVLGQQLAFVEHAGWHLLSMIDDVLDLSRLEAGRVDLRVEPVVLDDVVDEAVAAAQTQAARRGVTLHVAGRDALPRQVAADRVRLGQVLAHLLSNAIKFNQPDGRVDVTVQADADGATVAVSDTGRGLTPEQLGHLFEPFNRLAAPSHVEGSGIGLVIARNLVQLMHGRLDVHSVAGEGSTFSVWLPHPSAAPLSPTGDDAGAELPSRPCRVLYIEDVESNIELMRHALQGTPWTLRVERTGTEGLAAAVESAPDLILLDLQLPDLDGLEVRRRLLDDPATMAIPCLAVTADAAARQRAHLGVAFDGWLGKPLRLGALRRAMADAVRMRP